MKLPNNQGELFSAILERRNAIRNHRDQKMDDRCWVDDYWIWKFLDNFKGEPELPSFEEGMKLCRDYFHHRSTKTTDETPKNAIQNPSNWDDDLKKMDETDLKKELERIQFAIQNHNNIHNRKRTVEDDRQLYSVLPEKISADFRLPPESDFLGEAKAPKAGCPSFWRSHANCPTKKHNLHTWGPCKETLLKP